MSAPPLSILLPCHNAQATLDEAIMSIRAQTWVAWEMIVFDDGSTDASLFIAREHARRDRRIRVIGSPKVGLVEALRAGASHARGLLLARMDADDVARPERLARQVAFLDTHPEVALCGTGTYNLGDSIARGRREYDEWINALVSHEEIVREIFVECPIAHPTFMMRREAFEEAGGYQDRGWAEDYDLVLRLHLAGKRFGKVPEPLLGWRESAERLSRTDARYSPEQFRACKRHYLFQSRLATPRPLMQWGAGDVGKEWLREWPEDRRPLAAVDVNPRKLGQWIHGVRVISPEELEPQLAARPYIIVAVGAPGARDQIRAWLSPRGYREAEDYLFVA